MARFRLRAFGKGTPTPSPTPPSSQFLRPDSNVTQTSFTNGYTNIDESVASNVDFAYGTNNTAAVLEVGLSNPTGVPSSGTTTVRYRVGKTNAGVLSGTGNACTVTARLYQGATLIATDTARTATGTWTDYTWTPSMASVTDWTDLRLRFTTSASGGNASNARGGAVSWAEMECPSDSSVTITTAATSSVAEGATLAVALTATGESPTWAIVGGADAAEFEIEISGSTLRWASNGVQDYGAPDDVGGNNTYVVIVRATDAVGNTADLTHTTTVTEVAEAGTYDTRFGTATDADGWITFGLKSGCRRVWLNSSMADDIGDGLTAATAKKTFGAALNVFIDGSRLPGDQLMIAGTGGRTYTDNSPYSGVAGYTDGFSLTYPTAVLSYDPADAANTVLYGKLVGPDMPVINLTAADCSFSMSGYDASYPGYFFMQGIAYTTAVAGAGMSHTGRKDGLGIQNCRFNGMAFAVNATNYLIVGRADGPHVSKCSFTGQWNTDSNNSGLYVSGTDGGYFQDLHFAHCGWKLTAARGDSTASGGPDVLGHGFYYAPTNRNGHIDRIVYVDSAADGHNIRGGAVCSAIVTIDDPIAGVIGGFGGFSGPDIEEAADGVLITVDDWLIMGGANISPAKPRGYGPNTTNTVLGSYVKNMAMFDNPEYGADSNSIIVDSNAGTGTTPPTVEQYLTFENVRTYLYADTLHGGVTGPDNPTRIHNTWTNCIMDVAVSGTNDTGTGNSVHSGGATFPLAKTREEVVETLMGTTYASWTAAKAATVNMMFQYPHLPWAQALISIGLPSLGLTPTNATVSPPSLVGLTPASIY